MSISSGYKQGQMSTYLVQHQIQRSEVSARLEMLTLCVQFPGYPSHQRRYMFLLMRLGLPASMRQRVPTLNGHHADTCSFIASMAPQNFAAANHPSFNIPGTDAILSSLSSLECLPSSVLQRITKFFASGTFTFGPRCKHLIYSHSQTRCRPRVAVANHQRSCNPSFANLTISKLFSF